MTRKRMCSSFEWSWRRPLLLLALWAALSLLSAPSALAWFDHFALQTATPLPEADSSTDYLTADWDGDGKADLAEVKRAATSPGTTVRILSGRSKYQQLLVGYGTELYTDANWDFALTRWDTDSKPDLVAVRRQPPPSRCLRGI